ncbi:MAG: hypothetical protein F4X66_10195 [Chloroflexi bacterium]|nr:hypothetical protein [Chloroflexota bacterium]
MADDKKQDSNDGLLFHLRLVPDGREGNKVYARSLRPGEEDTGEVVNVNAGDELIIRPGGMVVNSDEIDALSPKGFGGYAPIANTIWTWYRIVGEQVGFFVYLFALARRLDAAHAAWELAIQERDKARNEGAIGRRIGFFRALSEAEVAIITLHRGMNMLLRFNGVFPLGLEIPDSLKTLDPVVKEMRDAFEHIDERAQGKINQRGQMDAEALTIFDQPDFIESSILHYRGKDLHFEDDVLVALLSCRELVLKIIDLRVAAQNSKG